MAGCLNDEAGGKTIAGKTSLTGRLPKTLEEIKTAAFDEIKGLMAGVPCQAPGVNMETSKNLLKLGSLKFETGGTQEVDIHGDWILMARGGSGFGLANISDPLRPYFYSNWTETKGGLDVKFSPDNRTALVGAGWGIDVVDISDPFVPARASQFQFKDQEQLPTGPGGGPNQNAHMIYTAHIKDQDWVFLAPNSNTGVWILKMTGEPAERKLTYVTRTLPLEGGPLGPHDMFVHYDQDAKKWLLYSADGYHGWAVFDVSDPAKPTLAGGIVRPETGYTHTIQAAKIGSKRIVVTIAEVGVNVLQVYDATNLQAPILLGAWHVAEAYGTDAAGASMQVAAPQHNFNIVAGKLYVAHYVNGLFVFDLTKVTTPVAGTADLKPIAHYASGATSLGPSLFGQFWDVVLKDGLLYGSNMSSGVHIVGYGCNPPGEATLTSIG